MPADHHKHDNPAPSGDLKPRWTVVCNMTDEVREGHEAHRRYQGTRIFTPGTKLYCGQRDGGMQRSTHVIGLGRNRRKFVNSWVRIKLLKNPRPQLLYSPGTLSDLARLNALFFEDRNQAERHADYLAYWAVRNLGLDRFTVPAEEVEQGIVRIEIPVGLNEIYEGVWEAPTWLSVLADFEIETVVGPAAWEGEIRCRARTT